MIRSRVSLRASWRVPLMALLVLSSVVLAWGQSGRIQGVITDPQGAAVAGAKVQVTNLGTNRTSVVTSNRSGEYQDLALPPGDYAVTVTRSGFNTITQRLTLRLAQAAALNFHLTVGAVSQTVEVTGGAPLVNSLTSSLGSVVVGRQITDLPLNGRNFTQLATLVPGVTRGVADGHATGAGGDAETFRYGDSGGAALSVNGVRPQANNFLLDGVDNNESLVNTIIFFPPADAIQEFRVTTSVAPAQYGRSGGAIVQARLKSGTNQWHGSLFDFLRNSALDARPSLAPTRTPFRRNQFGGTLGGPILHNKLFIFGDYQGWRQSLPLSVQYVTVPTQAMRTGDFSQLLSPLKTGNSTSGPYVIYNPDTGKPFAGNIIPSGDINKAGQNYLNAFPLPDIAGDSPHCGATSAAGDCIWQNYMVVPNQTQNFNDFDVRADWDIREADTAFLSYSFGQDDSTTSSFFQKLPAGFGTGQNFNHPRGLALGETHVFTPDLINDFHFGAIRTEYGYTPPLDNEPVSANLGIVNANTSPLLGGGALIGGYNTQIEYTGDYGPYLIPQNSFEETDTMSWIHGNQTLHFGATIIRRQLNEFRPTDGKGYFFLFGNGGGESPTHYEVSDLLDGFVGSYSVGPPLGMVGTRSWETGYYLQDDYRVTHRLTLNLGLRYDLFTPPTEVYDRQSNFNLATGQIDVAGANGASAALVNTPKNDWAPRLGFAYDLSGDGREVIRGGYGIFYFLDRGGIDNQLTQNPPFSGASTFNYTSGYRITLSGQAPQGSTNPAAATASLPIAGFNTVDLQKPANVSVLAELPGNGTPRMQEWNLTFERQLGQNMAADISYVGNHGSDLMTYYNLNQQEFAKPAGTELYPVLAGAVNVQAAIGISNYNALELQLRRRMSDGWLFNVNYTWSHALDDSAGAFDGQGPIYVNDIRGDYGNSDVDVRQRLIFSSLYTLPFGRGRRFGGGISPWLNEAVGGWQLNAILTLQTGMPFDLTDGGNPGTRPDLVGPVTLPHTTAEWFDPKAFAPVPETIVPGVSNGPGNVARNFLYGPGLADLDLSIFKDFHIGERVTTQLRGEFYNLTNTPEYGQPVADLTNGQAGEITSTLLSRERQIQLALRVTF